MSTSLTGFPLACGLCERAAKVVETADVQASLNLYNSHMLHITSFSHDEAHIMFSVATSPIDRYAEKLL